MLILDKIVLVNYHPFWFGMVPGVHRRKLATIDLIHGEGGRKIKVEPWEVLWVHRLFNGNLQVGITPDVEGYQRIGYIDADAPWRIECYSPHGELIQTITKDDVV